MGGASGRRPFVWYVAALAAVGALAAAGGQAACAAGIGVVGGAQATLYDPSMGQFADIDSFETPDGHSYLLALRYDRIYTIDVTEPFRPVRAGGITYDRLAGSLFWNVDIFRTPDGRVYAAVTGDGFSILDVTDPANPEMVYGVPEGADNASFGDARQVTVYERPDGRVHALVTGGNNALRTVDITDPYNPVALGGGPDLVPDMAGSAALYEPGDGRIYVMYGSIRMGVSIVDVTDPARPVLVSAIRHYDGDPPLGHEDYFQAHGIPAPSSSDVLISDGYAEGLGYVNEVAVFGSPDGRTYAMVANGMATIQAQSPGVGREPPQYDMVANGTAPIQVQSPGVGREPPQYDMVANGMATIQMDGSDPHIVPAGIIFLDVTDPHAPAPAGAILYGEDGFDFGSGIRDTAIREGPVPFPEGHRIDIGIGYPIRDIAILNSPDGRVHAAVVGDRGVTILDVTDPAGPVLLSHIWDGEDGFDHIDTVRGMDVVESPDGGTHLAMAGNEGVQMVDVTDPGEPVGAGSILGRSVHFAEPAVFGSDDGRTYVLGVSGDAVSMVEITDPSLPVPLGSIRDGEGGFDTLDGVWQVEALHAPDGRIYAVAAGWEGLQVIEVTDPRSPAPAGTLRNGTDGFEVGWSIISTAVLERPGGGGYLLVADHDRGIYAVDVTDPHDPALAGSLRDGEGGIDLLGGVHDMDVFGGPDGRPYALMTGDVGIHTIDMADPTTPVVAGTLDGSIYGTFGGHTLTLVHQSVVFEPAGGRIHALLADYTSGIHIIDLTDPYAPAYMGSVPAGEGGVEVIPGSAVAAVASPDGRAYALVAGWDDIQILDITDPHAPTPTGSILAGEGGLGLERTPWDIITMEPAGGRIHALASSGDRLWVLDVTYPVPPEVPRVDSWGGEGGLVSGSGPLGEVVGSVQAVLDEPGVGPMTDITAFESLDGRPHLVVVGDSETVRVVDVADPHRPVLAGAISDRWFADTWVKNVEAFEWPGGHVYAVASGNGEARILNVTDPSRPTLVGIADGPRVPANLRGADYITLFGTSDGRVHALALGWEVGLTVVDVTDPRRPIPVEGLAGLGIWSPESAGAVLVSSGGRVYAVAVGDAGDVYIADVTDPHRSALASVVRYAGDPSADDGTGPGPAGGPAATVIIPPSRTDILPEHAEVRISGTDGAGLRGADGVAIMEALGGRIYAAVANHDVASGEVHPRGVPAGILFIDITDPSRPVPAGAVRDGEGGFEIGSIGDMVVLEAPGGRAYMAVTGPGGLHMLDVTDPSRPVPAGAVRDGEGGFYNIGSAGIAVIGPSGDGRLYLATVGGGIQLVDVTDPTKPVPAGSIPDTPDAFYTTGGAEYTAAFSLVGRTYALGTGGDGVHILDVTDPSRPTPAGSAWDGRDGFDTLDAAHRIAVMESSGGPFLALVAGDEGIQILDIVNPSRPVPAGAIRYGEGGLDPQWVTDMEAYRSPAGRDYLLVAGHYTGIHVVDVTDPSRPVLVGGAAPAGDGKGLRGGCPGEDYPGPLDGIHGVDVYTADGRDYALVTCDGGIRILDLSDPAAPRLAGALPDGMSNHTFGIIHWAVLYEPPGGGIYALLAAYYGGIGIHIVDVTDPHRPVPAGSIPEDVFAPIPGIPVRIVAYGDRVLALAAGVGGIHVLDVTNPHHPTHADFLFVAGMGLLPFDSFPRYITPFESGEGKTHALVDGGEGALVLNMAPHSPAPGGGITIGMAGNGDVSALDGGRTLALIGAGHIIHVGGPESTMGFEWDLPPDSSDDIVGIVDLTDPYAPTIVGTVPSTYGRAGGIEMVYSPEGRAYGMAVGPAGGLLVTDVADPHVVYTPAAGLALAPDSSIEIFRPHDGRAHMVAGSGDYIRIIDVTYPTNPVQVSHIRDNLGGFYHLGDVRDISMFESGGGLVYALVGSGDGIQIIDVTNPHHPSPAGGIHKFSGGSSADGVHRTATVRTSDGVVLALAAGSAGRTAILDVTDPRDPVLAGTLCAGIVGYKDATGMWMAGECNPATEYSGHVPDVAVFETSDGRIRALITGHADSSILDITDPATPVPVVTIAGHGDLDIISVFESSAGRPYVLLAGDGNIWVGDLDDLTRLHDWGWP